MTHEKGIEECVLFPQDILPESYRGKRSHRSMKSVIKEAQKRGVLETEHQKLKRVKQENISKYSREFEEKGSFEYNINDDKLFRNLVFFCFILFCL
jgi:hypothetical protein